ncbi:protoporphyrinogen/coproporphyrinogen oxidase [Microbacterium sp. MC2]
MADSPAADLITHAHATRVAVVGGGIAGLVAALECAKVGMTVTLRESGARLGGQVQSAEVDGVVLDLAATGFSADDTALTALLDELGLAEDLITVPAGTRWISDAAGAAPVPADSALGVPANTWADDVRRFIGWGGAWRAYLDRLRPPLTIGHEQRLGPLVRRRMGARVVDRLVAPVTEGAFGLHPDRVDVDAALPGLNTALTRVGSLGGAVLQHASESVDRATLGDGMTAVIDALAVRIVELGGEVHTAAPVTGLTRGARGWTLTVDGFDEPVAADAVVFAAGRSAARRLLPDLVDPEDPTVPVDVVTLVVAAPELDAHPRGIGVYPAPGTSPALEVTHLTAAWPHLAEDLEAGRHGLQVILPASTDAVAEAGADAEARADTDTDTHAIAVADSAVIARARDAAAGLLGVTLGPERVRGVRRLRAERAEAAVAVGHAQRRDAVRRAATAAGDLAVVGEWVSGRGLEQVVADARAESERLRHTLLWARP